MRDIGNMEIRCYDDELETRYNPYHDPNNGRFTGPNGAAMYISKGTSTSAARQQHSNDVARWGKERAAMLSNPIPANNTKAFNDYMSAQKAFKQNTTTANYHKVLEAKAFSEELYKRFNALYQQNGKNNKQYGVAAHNSKSKKPRTNLFGDKLHTSHKSVI